MFTTVCRDVTWTNHWGTWKGRWQWFLKRMECSGVLTIVERFYLHEMPQCSMIHFFKRVGTAFKVPYALSSEIQQRKEKEADFHHCWFSVVPARICTYRLLQGSYQPGEPGEPGVFREKRLSLQVIREKAFFEEISRRKMMLSGRFFFTSVFVLCHSETLRDWSLNGFYVYLVPLLLYGNLNYSVFMFLYSSIWFLITKNFELIWYCVVIWFKVLFRIRIVLSYSLCFCSLLGLLFSYYIWWIIEYLHLYIIIFMIIFIIITISHITILGWTLNEDVKVKVSVLKYFAISTVHWQTSKLHSKLSAFFKFRLNKNV